jgi:hypothetical protein
MQRTCASCGRPYDAKRPSSKFCGDTCRKRAQRAPGVAPIVEDAPAASSSGLVDATERELVTAGRLDSMLGQASLELARRISDRHESGASIASLTKQLRETMADALKGAATAADPLDELRARRDEKRAAG